MESDQSVIYNVPSSGIYDETDFKNLFLPALCCICENFQPNLMPFSREHTRMGCWDNFITEMALSQ